MVSVYHPFFRGKQFEFLVIREKVELLLHSGFCPIIEPVNSSLAGLRRTIETLAAHHVPYVLIVNPKCTSETVARPEAFLRIMEDFSMAEGMAQIGIIMDESSNLDEFHDIVSIAKHPVAIIHDGFLDSKALADAARTVNISANIFIESKCSKLYRRNFPDPKRVLIRDGFRKRPRNSDYPPFEEFSDLHLLYEEELMNGFGDYLIAGEEYTEGGGPARAVAIHVTVIDPRADNLMMIYHFVSNNNATSTNPGGKFVEALDKLVTQVGAPNSTILQTSAISEFIELHSRKHFPGLGYVKKLSMAHHLETMSEFLGR